MFFIFYNELFNFESDILNHSLSRLKYLNKTNNTKLYILYFLFINVYETMFYYIYYFILSGFILRLI